jgi:hypothetical protein
VVDDVEAECRATRTCSIEEPAQTISDAGSDFSSMVVALGLSIGHPTLCHRLRTDHANRDFTVVEIAVAFAITTVDRGTAPR